MSWLDSLRRFAALPSRRRRHLAEALLFLAFASFAVRFLPFRWVMAIAGRVPTVINRPTEGGDMIKELRSALQIWVGRVPWRAVCFQLGLALHIMLRMRGVSSVLHYGVRISRDEGLKAHVWVTYRHHPVIGVEEAEGYTCLASVPALA